MRAILLLAACALGSVVEEPKFQVKYNERAISPILAGSVASENYKVVHKDDTKYLCYLPDQQDIHEFMTIRSQNATELLPVRTSDEVLDSFTGKFSSFFSENCVFTSGLNDAYWTYGYCFGDKVVQFHENILVFQATGKHIPEHPAEVIVLGRFNGSNSRTPTLQNQSTVKSRTLTSRDFEIIEDPVYTSDKPNHKRRALKQELGDGTMCDLTSEPRKVDVIYRCDTAIGLGVVAVYELKTCHYRMVVNVRNLCDIPEFAPTKVDEPIMDVVCNPIVESASSEVDLTKYVPDTKEVVFPQPRDVRIDLQQFEIVPGGDGFFWGRPLHYRDSKDLYDRRSIIIFNEAISDSQEDKVIFAKRALRFFVNSMEFKVYSPDPNSENKLATWADTFTAYYEVYNQFGEFIFILRIARAADPKTKQVVGLVIDPFEMVDQDGDPVSVHADPNRQLYEYAHFVRNGDAGPKAVLEEDRVDHLVLVLQQHLSEELQAAIQALSAQAAQQAVQQVVQRVREAQGEREKEEQEEKEENEEKEEEEKEENEEKEEKEEKEEQEEEEQTQEK